MADSTSSQPIVIIGAGVLALSTAIHLQSLSPSTAITIIASELPTDASPSASYASAWAGAHYRPIPGDTPQLLAEKELAIQTFDVMRGVAKQYSVAQAGVKLMKGVEYIESPTSVEYALETGDIYAGPNDGFRVLERSELPDGVKWGCEYNTYSLNVPVYLRWMMRRFQLNGGRVVKYNLECAEEVFDHADKLMLGNVKTAINCSGMNFGRDLKTNVIRGQTVLVKQEFNKTITRQMADGSWSFLIPRPGGGTIVGGSKEVNDFETGVRRETRERLLISAARYFPEFVDQVNKFDVVKDNVGRRPWREGGMRIEKQHLSRGRTIVHGYGAGGRGYELSWGAAAKITELVLDGSALPPSL
jgi:glycine/D-amino acid oxidase-like deaminating enzyme